MQVTRTDISKGMYQFKFQGKKLCYRNQGHGKKEILRKYVKINYDNVVRILYDFKQLIFTNKIHITGITNPFTQYNSNMTIKIVT